jgi:dienelactone hydrolase
MMAGGMGGMMTAGTGGAAGGAGTGGMPAGDCGPEAFACRGDAPTMASALGTAKGPYATMSYTSGFRNGSAFAGATIYYPTGDAKPPFGCVTVVPGFTAYQSSIRDWGPFLASHGIVTMTIDTNTTSDPPATRANALLDALMSCLGENDRMGSPIMGKLSKDHQGVSGWSMGGGGTLIAASRTPTLKAGVSFAAWGPTGGANNKVPVLMFEATADPLAAGMSDSFYAATPEDVPKMLFEVQGSSHNVANSPRNHEGIIGLYGLSWWKVFMEGDMRYKQFLTAPKPSITTSKFKTNVK